MSASVAEAEKLVYTVRGSPVRKALREQRYGSENGPENDPSAPRSHSPREHAVTYASAFSVAQLNENENCLPGLGLCDPLSQDADIGTNEVAHLTTGSIFSSSGNSRAAIYHVCSYRKARAARNESATEVSHTVAARSTGSAEPPAKSVHGNAPGSQTLHHLHAEEAVFSCGLEDPQTSTRIVIDGDKVHSSSAPRSTGSEAVRDIQSAATRVHGDIASSPGDPASNALSNKAFRSAGSSAALPLWHHLPSELFRPILRHLYDVSFWESDTTEKESLRRIGNCALTCKFWADELRGILLEKLYMRSYRDVRRMQDVLDPPVGFRLAHPADLIRRLWLVCRDPDPTWVYQASAVVSFYVELRSNVLIFLDLDDRRSSDPPTISARTIFHHLLPQGWAASFRQQFYELSLSHRRFRCPDDFFHLISEFYNLRRLTLRDISWDSKPPQSSSALFPSFLYDVIICEEDRFGLDGRGILPWILAAAMEFPVPRKRTARREKLPLLLRTPHNIPLLPPLEPLQFLRILDMLDTFYRPDVSHIPTSSEQLVWNIKRHLYEGELTSEARLFVYGTQASPQANHANFLPNVTPRLEIVLEPRPTRTPGQHHLYVTELYVELCTLELTTKELLLYDWKSVISASSPLAHLELVDLCLNSREQCEAVMNECIELVAKVLDGRREKGMALCAYQCSADGLGALWSSAQV